MECLDIQLSFLYILLTPKRVLIKSNPLKHPRHVGIDEFSIRKGHSYLLICFHPVVRLNTVSGQERDELISHIMKSKYTSTSYKNLFDLKKVKHMKVNRRILGEAIFFFFVSFIVIIEGFRVKKYISAFNLSRPLRTDNYLQAVGLAIGICATLFVFSPIVHLKASKLKIKEISLPVIILMAYVFAVQSLGFFLSTVLFYYVFLHWISGYSHKKSLFISGIITVCCELIFLTAFNLALPTGIIENFFYFLGGYWRV